MHRVTLPEDATKDEKAAADAAIDLGIVKQEDVIKDADKAPEKK